MGAGQAQNMGIAGIPAPFGWIDPALEVHFDTFVAGIDDDRFLIALFVALLVLIFAQTDGHTHDHHNEAETVSANEPPIKITINPEARVSVVLSGALPRPVPCGTVADLPVKIVNQAFVTSRLKAEFVGDVPAGVSLDFQPAPLKGMREEIRTLRITLTKPDLTDLTIAFRARNEPPDLGGRDRIHFLMHCLQIH